MRRVGRSAATNDDGHRDEQHDADHDEQETTETLGTMGMLAAHGQLAL